MSHKNAEKLMQRIKGRPGVRSAVLFTRKNKILSRTCDEKSARKIMKTTLALLRSLDETISKKYESRLTLQSLRTRGEKEGEGMYIYIIRGDDHILTLLQETPMSQEEKKILEKIKQIKELI